jgi:hypothetical protein
VAIDEIQKENMKFILAFSICSAITGFCNNTATLPTKFDSWSECVGAGGKLIIDASIKLKKQFNEDKLYLTYFCNEVPNEDI